MGKFGKKPAATTAAATSQAKKLSFGAKVAADKQAKADRRNAIVGKKAIEEEAKRKAAEKAKEEEAKLPAPTTGKLASEPEGGTVKDTKTILRNQSHQKMTNRQKCLVVGSRNMTHKCRHLMNDFKDMLPHLRGHDKLQNRDQAPHHLRELCELHHCNTCMFLEGRKHAGTFLWLAQCPSGPSIKFELMNMHTADELRMAGNCLKYSRGMLHFDHEFETVPTLRIAKSLLTNVFNVPRYHPKSKPFVDHIFCFFYLDGRIWMRHYQVITPPPATPNKKQEGQAANEEHEVDLKEDEPTAAKLAKAVHHATGTELANLRLMEIGPRLVLEPLTILNGAFSGTVLWKNESAQTPTEQRMSRKLRQRQKADENAYVQESGKRYRERNPGPVPDPLEGVFAN